MNNLAKIERVAGLYRIRTLPDGVRHPQVVTAQPSYKLAVRHIKVRFPGFRIVDAKTFDREHARREREQTLAKEGIEA